jgi:ATP-dependent DNA helicase PIF1
MTSNTLSNEQESVLKLVLANKSVLFTGCAGTGKSFLLCRIIESLKQKYATDEGALGITACTGIAAVNIGGCTLHSLLYVKTTQY